MRIFLNAVARVSFAALLISVAIALVAGLGTRFGLWSYDRGLSGIFPWSLYAGIAAFALGLAWMATAFFAGAGAGALYAVTGFVGAIALLWVPLNDLYLERVAHALPPIHDISTDTEHAPAFVTGVPGARGSFAYDGQRQVRFDGRTYAAATLQKLYYGDLQPYSQLGTTPAKLFRRALAAARRMGWTIVAVAPAADGGRIQATDTTLLFGLTDDIVIRIEPAGIGLRLDIRSRSRDGQSDFGRDAARIRAYRKKLVAG
ncbi:MAG: DUF1499 domain-containing protein [Rhizomicrobium sp.]